MDNPAGTDLNILIENLENLVEETAPKPGSPEDDEFVLSSEEKDILGEVGNICMGTSATTLSALLSKKVTITTPNVSVCRTAQELGHYQKPFLTVEVSYTEGIEGYNILLIQEHDVKVITDILMGGDGVADPDTAIDELHFSAISEVMNQMVGASSTSLSNLLMRTINITPPRVKRIVLEEDDLSTLACQNDTVIKISFSLEIEGVLHSELMQLIPYSFGKELVAEMKGPSQEAPTPPKPAPASAAAPQPSIPRAAAPQPVVQQPVPKEAAAPAQPAPSHAPRTGAYQQSDYGAQPHVGVKFMQYESFDEDKNTLIPGSENIGLILDVPLQITVELGKCRKSIKDILGFNMGSIIVLDKLAGEMVDILVNGKLFARGEVVVIDDNYGVRVTDIVAVPQFLN